MLKKIILAVVALIAITIVVVTLVAVDSWIARIVIVGFIAVTIPAILRKDPPEPEMK